MTVPLVEMRGITKTFPGVLANDNVNFTVRPGEIHALLGENGSGKSTLMSILSGLYRPDKGEILVRGEEKIFRSPKDAITAGIGMVHQHFKLVDTFTVAENIILGDKGIPLFLNKKQIRDKIGEMSSELGLEVNPEARVWQLSVGERQRVEIVKMLYRGSQLLIMDEPTAVLTPQEARELFKNLKIMAAGGRSVVLITHKLNEVMAVADRVTVMKSGRATVTLTGEQISEKEMARQMVGREVLLNYQKEKIVPGGVVLGLKGVSSLNDQMRRGLNNFSLDVREGEIVGIAGVAGNGQKELAEMLAGLRWVTSGKIFIDGKEVTNLSPREIMDFGVSYVPEDRLGMGLVPELSGTENLMLKNYRKPEVAGRWLIKGREAKQAAEKLVKDFDVRMLSPGQPVKMLSGGNLQKLLLAREITANPRIMVVVYPSRGLDVGATEAVHRLLLEQRLSGAAILLISEDLEEIFKLSDRIGVLFEGELQGIRITGETNLEEIGLLMMGAGKMKGEAS